jgi:hypothetical protein
MSIGNNKDGRKEGSFFAWNGGDRRVTGVSTNLALTLIAGIGFVLLSPPSITTTTITPAAFAQEESDNTSITGTATTTNDTTTTTDTMPSPLSGLELSSQPIWDEQATSTSVTAINETHRVATFIGNGTMIVPHTGETINMTNNGTAFISFVPGYIDTVSAYGREYVFSEDDNDTTAITFNEIIRYDSETFEGKGVVIAVFDKNATGSLAPFNGMMVVGTHEEDPSTQAATIRLWEWEAGIPIPSIITDMDQSTASPLNTTATTDAIESNTTEATEGEQGQEQQTTPSIAPTPLLE